MTRRWTPATLYYSWCFTAGLGPSRSHPLMPFYRQFCSPLHTTTSPLCFHPLPHTPASLPPLPHLPPPRSHTPPHGFRSLPEWTLPPHPTGFPTTCHPTPSPACLYLFLPFGHSPCFGTFPGQFQVYPIPHPHPTRPGEDRRPSGC